MERHSASNTIHPFTSELTHGCLLNCRKKPKTRSASKAEKQAAAIYKTEPFTLGDVVSSAESGCRGCRFLAALLTGLGSVYGYSELHLAGMAFKWLGSSFTLEITDGDRKREIQYFTLRDTRPRVQGMPESTMLTGNTALPTSFERAHVFIQACEATHEQCGSGRNVPLSKRVLDVTEITSEMGHPGIRLETTEAETGTYVCLSHCWGDASKIHTKTLTTTIDEYHRFIAWTDLPKTFRDAVVLTRRLRVKYLWIDSLCIIQDSRVDWETESVKMGEIYRNSYLTIAAAASAQSSGGCFSETIPDGRLEIQDPEFRDISIGVRDCQGAGKVDLKRDKERTIRAHFPLFTRAWVYQERMLSRRILFCARSEFQVGCQEILRCECGGGAIAPHFRPLPSTMNVAKLKTLSQLRPDEGGGGLVGDDFTMLIYRNYLDIVESYARLDIKVPSDRLPAISATAKIMSQNIQSEYLAGIWRATLMEGLLWYVRGRPSRPRPAMGERDWRAPSWSWASVDAPEGISFIQPGKKFSAFFDNKIERAECVLAGANPLGEVTSGFIRLRASLGAAFWRTRCRGCSTPVQRTKTQGTQRADCALYTVEADGPLNQVWTRCAFAEPALDLLGASVWFYADSYVDRDRYGFFRCIGKGSCRIAPCYLLYVPREKRSDMVGDTRIPADAFLVLTKLQPENTFERVGLALISHGSEDRRSRWFKEVWHALVSPEESITLV
ncbi:HET domain-containing protein [Aspergillus lucknowensis]|uniref:Heterokaryon incompatibility protein-domain-containing protein n=1 Tax=Aspergillus lucknowensis TaxID=176173 RepID=A0ABR4LL54_9EURO